MSETSAVEAPNRTVTLIDNATGRRYELPVMQGTTGPDVIDVRRLYQDTGFFTFDPGYTSTGSCESSITYIDGDKGVLLYRGYPIEQLADHSDFMEVCYLLLYGDLPNADQKRRFEHDITYHTMVHEQMHKFIEGLRRDSHPMAVMVGMVGALSAFYHDSTDITNPRHRMVASYRMIAKMPTLAAWSYKYSLGQPFIYPRNDLRYSENFLHMMFATPCEPYKVNPVLAKAMDRVLILHADHEQNASTSTVRLAGSIGDKSRVPEYVRRAKDKDDPFRLMGFGHRVYHNYDPRARIVRQTCHEVLDELGVRDEPLLDLAMELERIALEDEYFVSKKLYPNVDFYSGIIFRAMGIPVTMFTVLFAVARTVGWVAQWNEMIEDPTQKIGRPRQLYTGPARREFKPLAQRG